MKFLPAIESMLSKGLPYLIKGGEKFAPLVFIDDLCELMIRASGNRKAVGKCYTAIPREEAGIHDVLQRIAETRGYSFPQHKKNKLPLVIQAMLWGLLYRAMGKKERPPINLRLINLLSIRGKAFDLDARKDLDWNTGHSLDEGLQLALAWNADAHT
jgi:nucleoside-diphosphate-sugar epimerase